MEKRKKMTPEEAANIVDRYHKGQSLRFIGYALDRTHVTLKKVLMEAGVTIRAAKLPAELEFRNHYKPKLKKAS
jgi:hypothetical protein